jgi:3-dehydroquinate dehydratase-1
MGQISRSFNKIFTPITHPLLPMVAAPGQLSAAEINQSLHGLGEMPKLDFYGIGANRSKGQDMFFEKCFNELSLPHQIIHVHANPNDCIDSLLKRPNFGGAYLNPPLTVSKSGSISLSNSAKATGLIDTVFLRSDGSQNAFVGENASWKGIRATLTRDYVPSAYNGRAALVLASHQNDAASAIFALKSLDIAQIFTIGFKPRGSFASDLTPVKAVEDLRNFNQPSVVISALPAEKSLLAGPLLKHYSSTARKTGPSGAKVFVDVVNGPKKGDPLAIAASLGWAAYGVDDVNAWTTVETLRLLVGQNVPYDFVRLASGQATY